LRAYNAAKCNCGRGFALNNAAGGVTARLPQILLVLRGRFVELRGEDRKEGGRKGAGEVMEMLILMRSCCQTA